LKKKFEKRKRKYIRYFGFEMIKPRVKKNKKKKNIGKKNINKKSLKAIYSKKSHSKQCSKIT
jgi:hypothetical protein